jgi:hypothetical protein
MVRGRLSGVLHSILAASKLDVLTTVFVGLVQDFSGDDPASYSLGHLEWVACKVTRDELQQLLARYHCLEIFCYTPLAFDLDFLVGEGPLD